MKVDVQTFNKSFHCIVCVCVCVCVFVSSVPACMCVCVCVYVQPYNRVVGWLNLGSHTLASLPDNFLIRVCRSLE